MSGSERHSSAVVNGFKRELWHHSHLFDSYHSFAARAQYWRQKLGHTVPSYNVMVMSDTFVWRKNNLILTLHHDLLRFIEKFTVDFWTTLQFCSNAPHCFFKTLFAFNWWAFTIRSIKLNFPFKVISLASYECSPKWGLMSLLPQRQPWLWAPCYQRCNKPTLFRTSHLSFPFSLNPQV